MRGPIDFIVVGFEGKKFDGTILQTLSDPVEKEIISVLALAIISKDSEGTVTVLDANQIDDTVVVELMKRSADSNVNVEQDDIDEVTELLENNTAAALLVIEQLWAKPLKEALLNANGVLVSEGRIHPDAALELSK